MGCSVCVLRYFVTAPESWKATMRNVLTSHSCFVKVPRPADAPGRGDWWSTVDLPLCKPLSFFLFFF